MFRRSLAWLVFLFAVACAGEKNIGSPTPKSEVAATSATDSPALTSEVAATSPTENFEPVKPSVSSEERKVVEEKSSPGTGKQSSLVQEDFPFHLSCGDKELLLYQESWQPLINESSLELRWNRPLFLYVFQRLSNSVVSPLQNYWLTVSKKPAIGILLESVDQDQDWFLIPSSHELPSEQWSEIATFLEKPAAQLANTARGLQESEIASQVQTKTKVQWHLYAMGFRWDSEAKELREIKVQSLARLHLYHAPFEVQFFVKSKGERKEFFPERHAVREGDELQLELEMHESAYLAVFLRTSQGEVRSLVPKVVGSKAPQLRAGAPYTDLLKGQKISFDASPGYECLAFFYQLEPLNCAELQKWIEKVDLKTYCPPEIARRGYVVDSKKKPPLQEKAAEKTTEEEIEVSGDSRKEPLSVEDIVARLKPHDSGNSKKKQEKTGEKTPEEEHRSPSFPPPPASLYLRYLQHE